MQKAAFITGTSRGIGKAIAELLLSEKYQVFGYSRTNTIDHPNFVFTRINLSDLEKVRMINFPKFNRAKVILINNAASIGDISPLNIKNTKGIINDYNLNIITPTLLCANFINTFNNSNKMIINISSGAANSAVPSWSTYCATKASLDALTNVIAAEHHRDLRVYSISPGIVDTKMQEEIRDAHPDLFPFLDKFVNYYANNELEDPTIIAQKLLYIIQNTNKFDQNIVSIRNIDIKQ